MDELDQQLLAAHKDNDGPRLVKLYTKAADRCESAQNIDAACFFLTHAYVFALEHGRPEATDLNNRLHSYGRAHSMQQETRNAQ